jgi:hypothetical protein
MKDFEKLVKSIMKECEADGEPITREEAEEMAKMEIKAKSVKDYTTTEKTKQKKKRTRTVDTEKLEILTSLAEVLTSKGYEISLENEKAIHFGEYTLRLIKHRPEK